MLNFVSAWAIVIGPDTEPEADGPGLVIPLLYVGIVPVVPLLYVGIVPVVPLL